MTTFDDEKEILVRHKVVVLRATSLVRAAVFKAVEEDLHLETLKIVPHTRSK